MSQRFMSRMRGFGDLGGIARLRGLSVAAALLSALAACSGESIDINQEGGGGSDPSSSVGTVGGEGGSQGQGGSANSANSTTSGRWVSAYYVGYQEALLPPSEIDWNGLTHLFIGRVTINPDASLNTSFDIDAQNGPALAKTLTTLAHQHGKKAIVMLGGAGEYNNWVAAAAPANRAQLVARLVSLAQDYGFDGFDLDWEPLPASDQPSLRALAEALRAALPQTILTLPVGWATINFPNVDAFYGEVAPLFDQINIMSYEMAGAWPGWESWHSSALFASSGSAPSSVDASVKAYLDAGVPADKIGVGIGFYGLCWSAPVNAPLSPLNGADIVAGDNVMSYANIVNDYAEQGARVWDANARVPYLSFSSPHGPQGCTFVSYEDEQSILEKGQYVRQNGLGGAIVWTINQGYLPNRPEGERNPLMKSLAEGFLKP